jgi:hypothetical protein
MTLHSLGRGLESVGIGHVQGQRESLPAGFFDLCGRRREPLSAARNKTDLCSLRGKGVRRCAPDTRRRSGNDDDF